MIRLFASVLMALVLAVVSPGQSRAQVAPSVAELATYTGLHAAAAQGDVALIKQLLAAGANVNATDPHGRTPMHVAAYRSHDAAVLALAKRAAIRTCWSATGTTSSPLPRLPMMRRWWRRR
jgi:hypothetical protein